MQRSIFQNDAPGTLVPISGSDPVLGTWEHVAFAPDPLPTDMPELSSPTIVAVADARAALAALDGTAGQLPNPTLFRSPTLRREAQSTSALEGTYAPLAEILTADEDEPASVEQAEIFNYVRMANHAFDSVAEGRPITESFLGDLQGILMRGTPVEGESGRLRESRVVIGQRATASADDFPVRSARFVPPPPDQWLSTGVQDLVTWMGADHSDRIDPLVGSAMAHYQFETLHPFRDGNGRLGRLLVVLHLLTAGVLSEPTLSVSPWFEARRAEYYERLLAVSTHGRWDDFVRFFAQGLRESAADTRARMVALVAVQAELKDAVRASRLRADSAHAVVDLALANPTFTVRRVEAELGISYGRANKLVSQLVDIGVLDVVDPHAYRRRFFAPRVLRTLSSN